MSNYKYKDTDEFITLTLDGYDISAIVESLYLTAMKSSDNTYIHLYRVLSDMQDAYTKNNPSMNNSIIGAIKFQKGKENA